MLCALLEMMPLDAVSRDKGEEERKGVVCGDGEKLCCRRAVRLVRRTEMIAVNPAGRGEGELAQRDHVPELTPAVRDNFPDRWPHLSSLAVA